MLLPISEGIIFNPENVRCNPGCVVRITPQAGAWFGSLVVDEIAYYLRSPSDVAPGTENARATEIQSRWGRRLFFVRTAPPRGPTTLPIEVLLGPRRRHGIHGHHLRTTGNGCDRGTIPGVASDASGPWSWIEMTRRPSSGDISAAIAAPSRGNRPFKPSTQKQSTTSSTTGRCASLATRTVRDRSLRPRHV